MGGYYTWSEMVSVLDQIAAAYPTITTAKFSLGTSIEGRDLWAVKLSDNPGVDEWEPEVRFDALHHACEAGSMHAVIWALLSLVEGYGTDAQATYIVDNREIWFIPAVNPDGYVYNETTDPGGGGMWRKNRRDNGGGVFGVDLNRNYPFQWGFDNTGSSPNPSSWQYRGTGPASEPEAAAMVAFITSRNFVTAASCHTYGDKWLYPWGYVTTGPANEAQFQEISGRATEINEYPYGSMGSLLYRANGVTIDFDLDERNTMSWTPEIGGGWGGFWPPVDLMVRLAEETEEGLLRTALAAGAYLYATSLTRDEIGDGDGWFENGESLEARYSVRNSGVYSPSTTVMLTLSCTSPFVTITSGAVDLGVISSFSETDNQLQPLSMTIVGDPPPGTGIPYTTAIEYEGYRIETEGILRIGEGRPFLTDDLEVELGWTAGVPGDTAVAGLWEWGDPVGTIFSGEDSNPEDDATPDPGVNCYATGNGSTFDDVSMGGTTLITPIIDLSGVGAATLSYSRWFADFWDDVGDELVVSITNDDGATWTTLENVHHTANWWTEVEFDVESHVALTNSIRLRFYTEDDPNDSVVEAAVDDLRIDVYDVKPRMNVYGRAELDTSVAFHLSGEPGGAWAIYYSSGTAVINLPFIDGPILIDPATAVLAFTGILPSEGIARTLLAIPDDPALVGLTLYLQGVRFGSGIQVTNRDEITFE